MNPATAWPLSRLKPFPRNARTHSEEQVSQIAASIREFGWTVPVLVTQDGVIVAGHGRALAARQLGMAEVPVIVVDRWSEAQIRAYVIADNKLAQNAGWDEQLLAVELDELRDLRFDLPLLGFAPGELNDLIGTPNTGPLNTAPQLAEGFKFSVIVGAKDETDQARLLERFEAEGLQCRPLITQ